MSIDGSTPIPATDRTRVVQLDAGQRRLPDHDHSTMVGHPGWRRPRAVPFEALFVAHYGAIRAFCRSQSAPGVAVIAVHVPSCRLVGRLWLAARPGRPATAIIGRHSQADLLLSDDAALSLRHLSLVIHPLSSWDGHDARFTVLDLRTGRAFRDESRRQLEAVRCEGPALVSCSDYALYFLQTGDATDWPPLAGDAWSMLPRRIYLDERGAEPDRWQRRGVRQDRVHRHALDEHTLITAIRGPVRSEDRLILEGEVPLGAFNVINERRARRFELGPSAASRGILFGRYSRCDAADLFSADVLSRTHLLVLRIEGVLYAIDTASTYGSFVDRGRHRLHEFRQIALDGPTSLVLADHRAAVRWHPAG